MAWRCWSIPNDQSMTVTDTTNTRMQVRVSISELHSFGVLPCYGRTSHTAGVDDMPVYISWLRWSIPNDRFYFSDSQTPNQLLYGGRVLTQTLLALVISRARTEHPILLVLSLMPVYLLSRAYPYLGWRG